LPSLASSPSGCRAARYAIDSAPEAFLNSSETQNCRAPMESDSPFAVLLDDTAPAAAAG